jgi:hypothetical protein
VVLADWNSLVIDFRYHLVSIIAVFLALAVGLVVGSTALSGQALKGLQAAQRGALSNIATLEHDKSGLTNQVSADQVFAQAAAPRLLPGLLSGVKVVEVTAPGADSGVTTGVTTALQQAGATVTGQVALNTAFLATDGHTEDQLTQLAQRVAGQAGVTLPTQSAGHVAGQQAAARVLAAGLLTDGSTGAAAANSAAILSAFSQANFVSIANGSTTLPPASLAVLVAPGGAPPQTGSQVLAAVAVALRNAGSGTVMVAGAASVGPGSVIGNEANTGQVSTVDNADTEVGQIMTVQALRRLLENKPPGQYGISPGAAPSPAPTPSVQPTTTPTTHPSSGGHK